MQAGLSSGQGEAASMTVVVDAASSAVGRLLVTSVSVSTRRQSDIRGLVTAGRVVRSEADRLSNIERDPVARQQDCS